jgi:hypothetical protein
VLTLVLLVQNTFPERPARLTWFGRLAYLIRLGLRHCGMNVALAIQNRKRVPQSDLWSRPTGDFRLGRYFERVPTCPPSSIGIGMALR